MFFFVSMVLDNSHITDLVGPKLTIILMKIFAGISISSDLACCDNMSSGSLWTLESLKMDKIYFDIFHFMYQSGLHISLDTL